MNKEKLVSLLLKLLIIIKVYHWKTTSYSEHKATDNLYSSLNANIDKFVEVLLGKNGSRLNMKGKNIDIKKYPSKKEELIIILKEYITLLDKLEKYIPLKGNSDLYNIRDEILADLNQFSYLLTFQ